MSKSYTAAVVGAGMGGKLSLAALAASDRFELVGVADLREEVRREVEQRYPGAPTFANHADMFNHCRPEVVCVSTWPPSHLEVTLAALELPLAGLLVEKPLADNSAAGRQLLDLIRVRNLPLVVPHGLLVADHSRQIIERVRQGQIGQLKLIEIQCSGWDIINAGIHWLNFVVSLLPEDPFRSVLAVCDGSTRTYRDGMQVETEAVTYAYTAAGVRVVMHTGDLIPVAQPGEGTLFRLAGSHGLLEFFGWKPRYRLVNPEHPQGVEVEVVAGPKSNHERYLDLLADQMDAGRADYTLAERSLAALELCEAAYLASHHRCAVTLPLQSFVPPPVSDWQPGAPYLGTGGGRDGRRLAQIAR